MGTRVIGRLSNGLILFEHTFTGPSSYTAGGGEYVQVECNRVMSVLGMDFRTTPTNYSALKITPVAVSRNLIFYRVFAFATEKLNGSNLSNFTFRVVFLGI